MEPTYRTLLFNVDMMDRTKVTAAVHVAFRCKFDDLALDRAIVQARAGVKAWYGDRAVRVVHALTAHQVTFLGHGISIEETGKPHGKG